MSMDIYSKEGTKIIFCYPDNSYDHQKQIAKTYLMVGKIYTVDHTEVSNWSTDVYLKEVPGIAFNSVLFDKASGNIRLTEEEQIEIGLRLADLQKQRSHLEKRRLEAISTVRRPYDELTDKVIDEIEELSHTLKIGFKQIELMDEAGSSDGLAIKLAEG